VKDPANTDDRQLASRLTVKMANDFRAPFAQWLPAQPSRFGINAP
jgi:hypothetical protein